jgi:hypothetical protein
MIENSEQKFRNFFEVDSRKRGEHDPVLILTDFYEQIFSELYVKYKAHLPKEYPTIVDNPFLRKIKENINLEKNENKVKNCDEVFFEYLKDISARCTKGYFLFTFKFVVLFRECINKFKINEIDKNKDYTEVYNSDQVPDLCNEFITEFMENADYFGLNSEENKNELIEIIQHFCFWLFDNGYTTSRLTLLTN